MRAHYVLLAVLLPFATNTALAQDRLQSSDLLRLRSVSGVEVSPDATRVAYTVENNDGTGRPYGQLWVMTLADGKTSRIGTGKEPSGNPNWSPDSQWIAYSGRVGDKAGLAIAHPDGTGARFLAEMTGTNSPLPTTGKTVAWSPDGKRIAFVSSVPGPETADSTGDPIVITRYLYKPDAAEGNTRFNDNRRLHIFVVDVASGRIEQLTEGTHYEHSIDWSPNGDEIAFISNREPNEDQFFNYDLFTLKVADKSIRRLTSTENAEYRPRWSPDGKTIAFTSKRGENEFAQIHLLAVDGGEARQLTTHASEVSDLSWTPDGAALYFSAPEAKTADEKTRDKAKDDVYAYDENYKNTHLWKVTVATKDEVRVTTGDYSVTSYDLSNDGRKIAFHRAPTPLLGSGDQSEVWLMNADGSGAVQLTRNTVQESNASLSPDAAQVLFLSGSNARFETYYNGRLFLVPAAGGAARPLVGENEPLAVDRAFWSADGKSIFFLANVGVHEELFVVPTAGGKPRQLTHDNGMMSGFAWLPDSTGL
jgi:Tol biopolymer transport system component